MMGTQPEIVFIKPKHGRKVPIPQYMRDTQEYFGEYLPEEGLQVQKTLFWIRRKQDDDIEEVSQFYTSPIVQETSDTAKTKLKKAKEETQE
ncbi:hypothetical protein SGGMMB4_01665 [Sodalis glossinidius str. 'morsitans']|uniref:Uncharacterized protein n=1 Tax=Sodalis glossinidius (strain morsitans) TaxID=343509 RepID=A0A193QH63_SODGM|nr:DUF2635 domain-containing protein [Sodalis glossinidius]CRL44529.1 hypothetical protein SGGMMB4_01665 [Sodalis glossinidius str. 'morsitans']